MERRKTEGANISLISTTWLRDNLKNPTSNVLRVVSPDKIQVGKLYFLFYDLAGALKSTKMEQFSPIFAIKTGYFKSKPILWGLNFNFMPDRAKVSWFDKIIETFFKGVMETNAEITQQRHLQPLNVTYEGVYRTLASIGFEYSIREYRMDLIDKVYEININEIDRFLTVNTESFSGVDQQKLVEIWLSKLTEGEDRMSKIQKDVLTDFKKMDAELEKSLVEIEKTKQFLSKI